MIVNICQVKRNLKVLNLIIHIRLMQIFHIEGLLHYYV